MIRKSMILLAAVSAISALVFYQDGMGQDKKNRLMPRVTSEALEEVLKGLDLTYKKEVEKDKNHAYTFQRGDTKIRLVNYSGEDLWIEAVFDRKVTLPQANQWNTEAKYTRCVLLENDGKLTASLEMQLDCVKGVTDGMIRQFLIRFGIELKEFQKFIGK